MQSRLTKSLYLGLAALTLGAVAATTTTASAKSYAKVTSSTTLKSAAETRNVVSTGKNAIYSKPGTVKGAKTVASKKTMKKLATSKKSADLFRAYSVATTNKGTVYYKVVSMNGKYRGYVYGGKTTSAYAGGIQSFATTTDATLPSNTAVYFAKPGKSNVTWNAPKYTQYKASKNVANTTPFAKDPLTVTKAVKKTREGSLYYYVEDAVNPSVSGWIYSGAVTTTLNTYNAKSDVKVNLTAADGTVIKTTTLSNLNADGTTTVAKATGTSVGTAATAAATDDVMKTVLAGTGYSYSAATNANKAALLAAKTGDTITLTLSKNENADTKIGFYAMSNDPMKGAQKLTAYTTGTADATTVAFPATTNAFTGAKDAAFSANDVQSFLSANSLTTLYTPSYKENGKQVYMKYTFNSAKNGFYGTAATAFFNATQLNGASPADKTTSTANTNYVG